MSQERHSMEHNNRYLSWGLAAWFALFGGGAVRADVILSGGDGRAPEVERSAPAGGGGEAVADAPVPDPGPSAEDADYFAANPDQVQSAASVEFIALAVLGLFLGAVYFFGATAHPTPGW